MKATLRLETTRAEGALVRVLGLARRRGYEIMFLVARCTEDGAHVALEMTVESDRPAAVLVRQLANLFDVERVELLEGKQRAAEPASVPPSCFATEPNDSATRRPSPVVP